MTITRRTFLQNSCAGISTAVMAPYFNWLLPAARAEFGYEGKSAEHLFVLIRTFGAMDVTLGLDPQVMPKDADDKDIFLEYRPEDIIQAEGLKFGPAAKPLVPFAKECLTINGVMMRRDAGHDVVNQYMVTGRGDGKAASLPAELALSVGAGPFGLAMNQGVYLAGKSMIVSSLFDLGNEAANGILIALMEERIKKFIPAGTPLEEAEKAIVAAKVTSGKLIAALEEMKKTYGTLTDQHLLAASCQAGAVQQAQLDITTKSGFLDTHSDHERNHLRIQTEVWTQVSDLFSLFKKTPYLKSNLFDYTTFMVISEFSRTPALNSAKGKDHNPFTNSVLLAGKNIMGGTTVGASRVIPQKKSKTGNPEHYAAPFNYKLGKLAESPKDASFFYPENVIRTVSHLFGDPANFAAVPAETLIIPGIVRS